MSDGDVPLRRPTMPHHGSDAFLLQPCLHITVKHLGYAHWESPRELTPRHAPTHTGAAPFDAEWARRANPSVLPIYAASLFRRVGLACARLSIVSMTKKTTATCAAALDIRYARLPKRSNS